MKSKQTVSIVGSGLAGSEAAFFLAERGVKVRLFEMRPHTLTEAHKTGNCAELVCSNSFKSKAIGSAPSLLKNEMILMGSLVLKAAKEHSVPGGDALTVDRDLFSKQITQILHSHPAITCVSEEIDNPDHLLKEGPVLIATGPLTSPKLSTWIAQATGENDLYFYDAIAPVIEASSINRDTVFLANRYGKGEEQAYLNCPMDEELYYRFVEALLSGQKVPPKNFEKEILFQGCQPIEAIASTGKESLRFGPMKPVGLPHPVTGKIPYAAIQLRPENRALTAYNMVGFQTKLRYPDQQRIFRMIPGLENAEFLRLGSIHRNTYVCAPKVLYPDLSLRAKPAVYLAGQITGVEGYLESAASGLVAAQFILQRLNRLPHAAPPASSAIGALLRHVTGSEPKHYQPNNIHFGLFDPAFFHGTENLKKDGLRTQIAAQTEVFFRSWWDHECKYLKP